MNNITLDIQGVITVNYTSLFIYSQINSSVSITNTTTIYKGIINNPSNIFPSAFGSVLNNGTNSTLNIIDYNESLSANFTDNFYYISSLGNLVYMNVQLNNCNFNWAMDILKKYKFNGLG